MYEMQTPETYKQLQDLADLARQGSRQALAVFREEVSPGLLTMVEYVSETGGQDLPAHRCIRAVLAALRGTIPDEGPLSERRLIGATARYLWDRVERRLRAGDALETIRG